MTSKRTVTLDLEPREVETLTRIMCSQGCSLAEALRWLIWQNGEAREENNQYMREYMFDYRKAKKLGITVPELRKRKP